jgi:hypothetical protein
MNLCVVTRCKGVVFSSRGLIRVPKRSQQKITATAHSGLRVLFEERTMGMRIPSGGAAAAASQSSVAQWQQKAPPLPAPAAPAAPKPTATSGHVLNVVA